MSGCDSSSSENNLSGVISGSVFVSAISDCGVTGGDGVSDRSNCSSSDSTFDSVSSFVSCSSVMLMNGVMSLMVKFRKGVRYEAPSGGSATSCLPWVGRKSSPLEAGMRGVNVDPINFPPSDWCPIMGCSWYFLWYECPLTR